MVGDGPPSAYLARLSSRARALNLKILSKVNLANILAGDTCTPISLSDFEAYLVFKERSPENLQFVVWFQDYRKRFMELPAHEQALSPGRSSFNFAAPSAAAIEIREAHSRQPIDESSPVDLNYATLSASPGSYPPRSPSPVSPITPPASPTQLLPILHHTFTQRLEDIPPDANMDVDSRRPFRSECLRVIATFLTPGCSKELSLDSRVRDTVVRDAQRNTHPDVFLPVYEEAYHMLEFSSLPNFLASATAEINISKQLFWYATGAFHCILAVAIALALILTLETPPQTRRIWRLFAVPVFWFGTMQLYSAWRGSGFCNRLFFHKSIQLRAWELEEVDEDTKDFVRQIMQDNFPSSPEGENRQSLGMLCNLPDGSQPEGRQGFARPIFPADDWPNPQASASSTSALGTTPPISRRKGRVPWHPEKAGVGLTRPPIFGPEKVVQDPLIRQVHQCVMKDIYFVGFIGALIFSAVVFALPGYHIM